MRIEQIELRQIRLHLTQPFETAVSRLTERDLIIVKLVTDQGVSYGEAPSFDNPSYTPETNGTNIHVISDFIAPALLRREVNSAEELHQILAFIRGHHMAVSAFDTAIHHLLAEQRGQSLSAFLGGTQAFIESGISLGIQKTPDALVGRVSQALNEGFRRIKIKIKPGWEIGPVRALRAAFGDIPLMVDANSAFTLDDAPLFQKLDEFHLLMIEQPLGFDDIYQHSKLQAQISTPVCLDESIESVADCEAALALGACKIINIKFARVGGLLPAVKIHNICQEHGIPVWCGGMVESALGQADALALASLPDFQFAADIAPSERYFAQDVIKPFVTMEEGRIAVPSGPGLGFVVDEEFLEEATLQKWIFE